MLPTKIIIYSKHKTQTPFGYKDSNPHKQPNLFFYLKNQLYPAVKQNLIQCQMIDGQHHSLQKIIIINDNLNIAKFQKVLEFFNSVNIVINTMKELDQYLNIFDYLQANSIVQYIQAMIEQDIQYYDVFCLLELAYNYGMQKVFDLCLRYLEFDQFQQIKYNKFDLLECNFKLFQIVLRRHHILKMKGQIQGLDVADIQQVIKLYCHRNQIDEQIQERLIKKYVDYLDKVQKVKTSLRLDKLAHKNILQSANIDSDLYQNQQLKDRPPRTYFRQRKRKYSAEVKNEGLQKIMKFSNNNYDCEEEQQPDAESILQDENQENSKYQINIKIDKKGQNQPNIYPNPQNLNKLEKTPYQEPDSIVCQISGMLNQYKQALNIHDQKFRNIRKNAQSTFFNSFRILNNQPHSQIMKSFNLGNNKGLFPIHQPAV